MYKEKDYNLLFDKHPQPMWIYEMDSWRFLAVNEAAILLYGYSREEFLKMNGKDIRLPEEIPRFVAQSMNFRKREHNETFQDAGLWQHRAKDGRVLTVRAAWSMVDWDEIKACMTCINDLTLEKRAQNEIHEWKNRYEAAVNASGQILYDWDCVTDTVVYGGGYEQILGYTYEDLKGGLARWRELQHPEDRQPFQKEIERVRGSKARFTLEYRMKRKDGSYITCIDSGHLLLDDMGKIQRVIGFVQDITQRKQFERMAQLQKEESKFRGLLEAAPDAMIIVDPGCTIALLNAQAEKLFGYNREELLGQQMDLLVPESCRALHPQNSAGHFKTPHRWPMAAALELMARRKDGSAFPSEIIFSPMETGEDLLVTAVIRDVTERKRHAEELESMRCQAEEANRLKSEFLANMSHELRTPLNSVIGFSELIHDGKAGPVTANQKEYLGDVLNSARHLLQLINDILDLAKVEAGKIQFRPEMLALDALIKEVCGNLRPVAEGKKIGVTIEIMPGLGTVEADPGRLKQVLYNYLSNALKFTPQGGRVHVLARPEGGGFFHLAVQDTGVGIPPQDVGRLFVAFQQLDESASKKFQGTGLGLALTKKIVEAQGGHVGVESAPGQGTVFYAELPRKPL